jgi:hypothetical protein
MAIFQANLIIGLTNFTNNILKYWGASLYYIVSLLKCLFSNQILKLYGEKSSNPNKWTLNLQGFCLFVFGTEV